MGFSLLSFVEISLTVLETLDGEILENFGEFPIFSKSVQ